MFDQPELERLLRTNLERLAAVTLRGDTEVTAVAQDGQGRSGSITPTGSAAPTAR